MQSAHYKKYLLVLLLVLFACNYLDRVALGLLLQDIKVDLHLSDTQLGFLGGISFALFYSVMGLPIARWADRGNRVAIISLTACLWSITVALSGAAVSFVQLMLIRIGVAVGEAGCSPPALSLIADYFDRAERPRAVALYTLGAPLSFLFGFFLAGWLNELYGWRITFVLLASPGLPLAFIAWLTLKEPRRTGDQRGLTFSADREASNSDATRGRGWQVFRTLWANATFRHMLICISVIYFFGYGILQWQPTFFVRSYDLDTREVGLWFAVTFGLGGVIGSYLGGELTSRYAANDERLQLKAMALAISSFGILSIFVYLAPNKYIAFGLIGLATMGLNLANGPLFATIQTIVPEHMRATSFATIYLFANFIGMGLGPLAVGAMSDAFQPWAGEESLRYALMFTAPGYFWGAWHLWWASRTVFRDLSLVQQVSRYGAECGDGRTELPHLVSLENNPKS